MSDNKDFRSEFLKDGKNVIISKKMKEIRLSRGMTQGDAAKELHIDRSVYAKYETGVDTYTRKNRNLPMSSTLISMNLEMCFCCYSRYIGT